MKLKSIIIITFLGLGISFAQVMPPSLEESKSEPIKYTGKINTAKEFYDGKLPHAVGVHHFQVFRSNRSFPSEPGVYGWTYNHQPYLAYWNDTYYLQFLQGEIQEHTPPTRILLSTSKNGEDWSNPDVLFPPYALLEITLDDEFVPAGTYAVMHQRMGWYVSSNDKLIASGFYSYCPTPKRSPNAGTGLGRVVREVYKDGNYGPIYFIRYNRHVGWTEDNTDFPFYKESNDNEFIKACDELLADKLITLQWWEEDRGQDGFYTIDPSKVPGGDVFHRKITTAKGAGKAFNYYERPDGVIVGVWKNQFAALTADRGQTWTDIAKNPTLLTSGAKTWAQKTKDNKYAIVHNQSATMRNRFPMAVLVGEDGYEFDRLYCLRGEMPPRKYQGMHKNPGAQYFRGIIEGNGDPPGDYMWNTYSMNKEDIWVSRVKLPIVASVEKEVRQNFENIEGIKDLELWNLYRMDWATQELGQEDNNRFLILKDEEPYDYSLAERIFPKSKSKSIKFRFRAPNLPQGTSVQVDVSDQRGNRALSLRIDKDYLSFDIENINLDPLKINPRKWHQVELRINCDDQTYQPIIDGNEVHSKIDFAFEVNEVERIEFRTGPYRGWVPSFVVESGIAKQSGYYSEDLPGSDIKAPLIEFHLDDIITEVAKNDK